jgi:peptidoglycan hydrolase-like protein with peptidoglycan-binding domain
MSWNGASQWEHGPAGPLALADYLIGLGGAYAESPAACLARVLFDSIGSPVVDSLTAHGLFDPATVFDGFTTARMAGVRPFLNRVLTVVAYPRHAFLQPLQPGDILVRRALGEPGLGHLAFVADHEAHTCEAARTRGLRTESNRPGFYVRVIEAGALPHRLTHRFARRVAGPDGLLPADTLLLRPRVSPRRQATRRTPAEALPEAPLSDDDANRAVQLNRQYAVQLGWGSRRDQIDALVGVDSSASDQEFAQAVANWQGQHGLSVDGIIGPDTWSAMQPLLRAAPAPTPPPAPSPAPSSSIDVNRAVQANRQYAVQLGWATRFDDIVALLGFNATPTEQDFANGVAMWQGQHALSVDGIIGPDTWATMQPLLTPPPGPGPLPVPPAPIPPLPTPPTPVPPTPVPPIPVPPVPVPPGPSSGDLIGVDLTDFVRGVSMGLTSDSAAKLQPPSGSGAITVTLSDPEGWSGSVLVDLNGASASGLRFPTEGMTGTVLDTLVWSKLTITDPTATGGAGLSLPLTRPFVLGTAQTTSGRTNITGGRVDLFPLETEIQAYTTCVFGYLVDGAAGTASPLDLSTVPVGQLQQFLANHGSLTPASTTRTALIAVYDLSLTSPKDDYQPTGGAPMGLANVVRTYPLLSLWSSRSLSTAAATLDMARPATSAMGGMARGGAISGAWYTDLNSGLRTLWDDTNPTIKWLIGANTLIPWLTLPAATVIAVYNVAPSTRWNSIFAHYSLDANRSNMTVVAPGLTRRTNSGDRQAWDTGSSTYMPTVVTKVERQGMFDNVHVAPVMDYQGVAAYMAPLCHHDCLHIHWRWGESYTDKPVTGWAGGKPYQKPGSPMIPENQTLQVSVTGPRVIYSPSAGPVPAGVWQIFMHHGTGYVSSLTAAGAMTPLMELAQLGSLPGFAPFYYHNRMFETGATRAADIPRLKESGFGPLEAM